jgi:magnesium chelatase family protein
MVGPPGTGKSMLAARLPGILPSMAEEEALESAAMQSLAAAPAQASHQPASFFRKSLPPHFESGANHCRPGGQRYHNQYSYCGSSAVSQDG